MKLIDSEIKVEKFSGIKYMKNIEKAMRNCYRSEDKIYADSYKSIIKSCILKGHESPIEHEKITVNFICDIGVYKDLTRHRHASFSVESTRYCAYEKDKYGNELTFIKPLFFNKSELFDEWQKVMNNIEASYLKMRDLGASVDEVRMILPHSIAARVFMSANLREWKHILTLRCSSKAHPAIQALLIPLLLLLKKEMPEIFEMVPYNENFPKEDYVNIRWED